MVKRSVLEVMERMYGPDAASPDLEILGEDESRDGLVMRLVKNYGNRALDVLDRVQDVRDRLRLTKKRRLR